MKVVGLCSRVESSCGRTFVGSRGGTFGWRLRWRFKTRRFVARRSIDLSGSRFVRYKSRESSPVIGRFWGIRRTQPTLRR